MKERLICLGLFCGLLPLCAGAADSAHNYLEWMRQSLPEVPEWTAWQEASGALPPDFEQLPRNNRLPDPFRFLDGRPVRNMAGDWEARRAEIRQLFEKYVTGSFPPKPEIDRAVPLDETRDEGYRIRNVRLEFGPQSRGSVRVRLIIPEHDEGDRLPVVIASSLDGIGSTLVRRGYISAGFAGNDWMDDAEPLRDLYPEHTFATLPRRAWLVRIVLDYLETVPEVDPDRIAIWGYSRDGKMATIAAAFDDRIDALIAGSTGVGGVLPWRLSGERGGGESIETTTRMFPSWFAPQLRFFSGREDRLPVDANLYLALIAPRAVLMQSGINDEVSSGWAIERTYASAENIYDRLGAHGRLGILHTPGFHSSFSPAMLERCIDWLDTQFGLTEGSWSNEFLFPWNFAEWRDRTGAQIDLDAYPVREAVPPPPDSLDAWESRKPEVLESISWMLGNQPPRLAPSPSDTRRRRQPGPGPTVIAEGETGNPGQFRPDVPAWVIAAGGREFGWLAPEKNRIESRRLRFARNVTGDLYYPAGTPPDARLPTVICLHGFHYPLGYMWVYRRDLHPILALVEAGYAVLAYDQTGFGMRWDEAAFFYDRHPRWSRLGKMVEDLQHAMDALEDESRVDPENLWVFGFTLGGTVGLYTAALDERIGGVVSISGFTPMRTDTADRGTSGMTRYSHQHGLLPRLGLFAGNESRLPYDYADLLALAAPRPLLVVQPSRDRDAHPEDVRLAVSFARNVYRFSDAEEQIELLEPDDYGRLTTSLQNRIIEWMQTHF